MCVSTLLPGVCGSKNGMKAIQVCEQCLFKEKARMCAQQCVCMGVCQQTLLLERGTSLPLLTTTQDSARYTL